MARIYKTPLIVLSLVLCQCYSFVSSEKWITDKCAAIVRSMPHFEDYESQDTPRCYIFGRCCEKWCKVKPAATQCKNDTFCCACNADDEPSCDGINQESRTTIFDEPSSTSEVDEHLSTSTTISTEDMSSTASIATPADDEGEETSDDTFDKSSTSDLLSILTTLSDSIRTTDSTMTDTDVIISVSNVYTNFSDDITTNDDQDNTVWTTEDLQTDATASTTSWPQEETSQTSETSGSYATESWETTESEILHFRCANYNKICNIRRDFLCATKNDRCATQCPDITLCKENLEVCEFFGTEICNLYSNLCYVMKAC